MKRIIFAFLFVLGATLTVTAQPAKDNANQCTDVTVQKLNVRGFYLGMRLSEVIDKFEFATQEDVNKLIKDAEESASKNFGGFSSSSYYLDAKKLKEKSRSENVSNISFYFVDNSLVSFSISYIEPKWKNVDQFIVKLSDAFQLPPAESWILYDDGSKKIKCGDYELSAQTNISDRGSSFRFSNKKILYVPSKRREEVEEKKRQTFKP